MHARFAQHPPAEIFYQFGLDCEFDDPSDRIAGKRRARTAQQRFHRNRLAGGKRHLWLVRDPEFLPLDRSSQLGQFKVALVRRRIQLLGKVVERSLAEDKLPEHKLQAR
jgi:hypothetical protein